MPHLLAAPDKFKGTADAQDIAGAICAAAASAGWSSESVPLADGGEGTLDVLGGPNRRSRVSGPLGEPVEAEWRLDGDGAVIEMARASGLALAGGPEANRPLEASTRGTGELILAAVGGGARRITVCVGGSATTDGGWGAVEVLDGRLSGVDLVVACDVRTEFRRAAADFAGQKGATESEVTMLERRLDRLTQVYRDRYGVDVTGLPGAGAAGGLAGGLAALGARLIPGFDLVADAVELDERVARADLVVTGEGFLDEQSFEGKVVGGVAELCAEAATPLLVVVGEVLAGVLGADLLPTGTEVVSLTETFGAEHSRTDPLNCIRTVVSRRLGPTSRNGRERE
ncbi:MAG TPA: glycerate kinase [Acidimicrobiales bacterium]|nr:glycerate kinase [Acidimicrobiales bacterium]